MKAAILAFLEGFIGSSKQMTNSTSEYLPRLQNFHSQIYLSLYNLEGFKRAVKSTTNQRTKI
jgi:hypothetical protein